MSEPPESFPVRVAEYIKKQGLISDGDHLLAAVSGGPDSVALLALLCDLKNILGIKRITVAHFNHRLRETESDEDREFVHTLAASANLDFHCGEADVLAFAKKRKISLEMAARDCRRSFLLRTAKELDAQKIALGHTADDQAEEVILRILRGVGPGGLQGMSNSTEQGIIRPLLFAVRDEILAFLKSSGIGFRIDSTNLTPSCRRNFLRLKVFPLLREAFHSQIAGTITRCAELAREEESWWTLQIQKIWNDICIDSSKDGCIFDVERTRQLHPALLRRVLRLAVGQVKGNLSGLSLAHLEPLVDFVLSGKTGKSVRVPDTVEAVRHGAKLIIRCRKCAARENSSDEVLRIHAAGNYIFGHCAFEFRFCENVKNNCSTDADCILMDSDKLKWPLELRFRRAGDRFQPFGMKGSKKLQDFFVDCGISREERPRVPILCDSEKICWVAGMRMDDRVKVEGHTRQILMVRISMDIQQQRPLPTKK